MSQGLSIANNLLANNVQYNLDKNQDALKTATTRLSSGLRINTAADDPSGLAIATNLQTQVDGFNTAVQNVQTANNATQVALGALSTTTDILQRIRSLAVEASSDINSQSDRNNLQAEVSQLLLEVNRISQNTSFNGQPLRRQSRRLPNPGDGSHRHGERRAREQGAGAPSPRQQWILIASYHGPGVSGLFQHDAEQHVSGRAGRQRRSDRRRNARAQGQYRRLDRSRDVHRSE